MDLAEIRKKAQKERAVQVVTGAEAAELLLREEEARRQPAQQAGGRELRPAAPVMDQELSKKQVELELEDLLAATPPRKRASRSMAASREEDFEELSPIEEVDDTAAVIPETKSPTPSTLVEPVEIKQEVVVLPPPHAPIQQEKELGQDPLSLLIAGREAAGIYDDLEGPVEAETGNSDFSQFLCFDLGSEEYAVNIMDIKEIVKPRDVTEVPRAPIFVPGVISLRGVIIPVYDMHLRLGLGNHEDGGKERIVVVKKGEELCGLMVDRVSKVVKVPRLAIEQPPVVLDGIDRDFVEGLGRYDGGMFILLDLERVLDITLSKD